MLEKHCPGLKGGIYCGNTIKYYASWDHIPDICPSCREKAKAMKAQRDAEWKEKPCKNPLCRNTVRYNIKWDKIPDYCKSCSGWQEKHCGVATCSTPVRYKAFWDNIPSYCPQHLKEMQQRQRPRYDEATSRDYPSIYATLPGSNSTAAEMGGNKAIILGFADGHKHVSVYNGRKGEPGNWHYSWNVDSSGRYQPGSAHFTDDGSGLVRQKFSDERRWFNG